MKGKNSCKISQKQKVPYAVSLPHREHLEKYLQLILSLNFTQLFNQHSLAVDNINTLYRFYNLTACEVIDFFNNSC